MFLIGSSEYLVTNWHFLRRLCNQYKVDSCWRRYFNWAVHWRFIPLPAYSSLPLFLAYGWKCDQSTSFLCCHFEDWWHALPSVMDSALLEPLPSLIFFTWGILSHQQKNDTIPSIQMLYNTGLITTNILLISNINVQINC